MIPLQGKTLIVSDESVSQSPTAFELFSININKSIITICISNNIMTTLSGETPTHINECLVSRLPL